MPRGNGDSGVTSTQIGMETRGSLSFSIFTAELKGGAISKRSVTDKEERQPCLGEQGLSTFTVRDRVIGKGDWEGESTVVKKERNLGEYMVTEATPVRSTCIQCC